jgi:dipeptidyl aminopeptidase/acylaminoacyl peptidase
MSPAWSPDGSKLAFISTRSDTPQVFLLDMNSMGDPVKLTDIPTGISTFKWAPGGEYILFTSEVFKGCEDFECNKKRLKNEETKKVTAIVSDILLYRHWNFWKAGKVSHLFSMRLDDKKIVDLTPGDSWVPFGPFQGAEQYTVSPDGKTVAFSKRTGDQPACDTNDDIYTVSIDGGDIEQITKAKGSDTTPRYSPDGKYLSYIKMARGGFESDRQVLMLINLATKKDFALTSSYDGDVSEYVWTPDSRRVYFTSISRGRIGLYNVGLQDRKVERLYQNGICGSPAISRDGKFLTYTWQNSMRPREIYRFNLVNNNPVRLTRMNEDVMSAIEMNPIEDIDFRGAGGDMVHGFILKPPFFDKTKKYPLIYIIHGGPQGATRDGFHYRWNLQMFASRGYVVASMNFHGSSGYGQKFEDSITYDWGGKPYRDLMIGLDHIVSKYRFVDRKRIGAAGASYGGYMISWIAGHTERFKCLVAHAGVYNLSSMYGATEELWFPEWEYHGTPWTNPSHYRKMSPSTYVKRFKTPTMVIHGQNDFRVPVTQGMEFFTALQKMGVESKFIYFPDESHFVQKPNNARFWYKQVLDWMDKYLKK